MVSRVGVELSERFSLKHDGEELLIRIERARLLEEGRAWAQIGGGNPHTLARAYLRRAQELAEGTDFDLEATS